MAVRAGAIPALILTPHLHTDYGDLVAARAAMVRAAKEATVKENTRFRVGAGIALGRYANEDGEGEETEHREFVVSDGRKMQVSGHLQGPQGEAVILQRHRQNVLQIMWVHF